MQREKKLIKLPAKLDAHFGIHDVLGDGSYGVVYLIYSKRVLPRPNVLALKVIDVKKAPSRRDVYTEAYINQTLKHKNLVKMYGHILLGNRLFVLNEYVSRGELFDYIKPECGVGKKTHTFLRQILDGVEYMHQQGYAHRDIKPENIMIDDQENLKIGDFGLSTLCVHMGRVRPLCKNCGTAPYVAPEVFEHLTYFGFPADVWSIGVVWVAMLVGELMWEKPDKYSDPQYQAWLDKKLKSPWERIPFDILTIVRKVLCPDPNKRLTIPEIRAAISQLHLPDFRLNPLREKVVREIVDGTSSHSQKVSFMSNELDSVCMRPPSFSQPLNRDMVLSQANSSMSPKAHFNRLIYRMTRFYARKSSLNDTKHAMKEVLEAHRLSYKMISASEFAVSATGVEFRINLYLMRKGDDDDDSDYLVEFRRSSGDGLRFQKIFTALKSTFSGSHPGIYLGVACFDNSKDVASQENDLSPEVLDDISKAIDPPLPEPGTPESFHRGFAQYQLKYMNSLKGEKRFRSPHTYLKVLKRMCVYEKKAVAEHDAKHKACEATVTEYEKAKRRLEFDMRYGKRFKSTHERTKSLENFKHNTNEEEKFIKHPGLYGTNAQMCGLILRPEEGHRCFFQHEKDVDIISGEPLSSECAKMKSTREQYQKQFNVSLRKKPGGEPKKRCELNSEEQDVYFYHFWSKPENMCRAPTEILNLLHFIDVQFRYRMSVNRNDVYKYL